MDPTHNLLSDKTISYLERVFPGKRGSPKEEYVINIISDTPVDDEHIKKVIRGEFEMQKDDFCFDMKRKTFKGLFLGIFGSIVLLIWWYLSFKAQVEVEIIYIVGWVAIWEVTSMIIRRPELMRRKKHLDRLINAEIRIQVVGKQELCQEEVTGTP